MHSRCLAFFPFKFFGGKNGFRRFVVCICVIEGKMVEELQFCFLFNFMVLGDGGFDG